MSMEVKSSTHPFAQCWIVVLGVKQVLVFLELFAELCSVWSFFQTTISCCEKTHRGMTRHENL